MNENQIKNEIQDIILRLDSFQKNLGTNRKAEPSLAAPYNTELQPLELFCIEPLNVPPKRPVEPFETETSGGKWLCDPKVINVLKLNGRDLPYRSLVLYSVVEINWISQVGGASCTTPCPRNDSGGIFPQLKLHSLVFALGSRGIGCQDKFGIEGSPGSPVWVAVNDFNYIDNEGKIVVRVRWQ